jgi:di/tricarboxylate transporter
MTVEILILFGIIVTMMWLMVTEKLPADTLSIITMCALIIGGFVTPEEGVSGLSNPAVVTVLCLMILTVGLESTGLINTIGNQLKGLLKGKEWKSMSILLLIVSLCSALISTTAIVIVFMRILLRLSKKIPFKLSRYLMPLSFVGIMGGASTLIGTSTNLIVSEIAQKNGLERFGIFDITPLGITITVVGIIYLIAVGRFMLSDSEAKGMVKDYNVGEYLTEVSVGKDSKLIGKRIEETAIYKDDEVYILEIKHRNDDFHTPMVGEVFQEGDEILIKSSVEKLAEFRKGNNLKLLASESDFDDDRINNEERTICEIYIKPNSRLSGKKLGDISFKKDYDAIPLAVKKDKKYYQSKLGEIYINTGDAILLDIGRVNFEKFYEESDFIVLQHYEDLNMRDDKQYLAGGIMLGVIILATLKVFPIMVSALLGCVLMLITGCLKLKDAYRKLEWNVYFLLAGVLPLGLALDKTGASELIADQFTSSIGSMSPQLLICLLYFTVTLFSSVISNNATAILFAPIVIAIAKKLNMSPEPLLITIMFAANMSFITPLGYQTNTLVYGVGNYRFGDFVKVGGLLSLIIWIVATILIPYLYMN